MKHLMIEVDDDFPNQAVSWRLTSMHQECTRSGGLTIKLEAMAMGPLPKKEANQEGLPTPITRSLKCVCESGLPHSPEGFCVKGLQSEDYAQLEKDYQFTKAPGEGRLQWQMWRRSAARRTPSPSQLDRLAAAVKFPYPKAMQEALQPLHKPKPECDCGARVGGWTHMNTPTFICSLLKGRS